MAKEGSRNAILSIAALVLTAGVVFLLLVPAVHESQTGDEAVYLVSGLSYWKTGDFRLNNEHPPLLKELLSVPLLASGATFEPSAPDWQGAGQWDVAPKVLFQNIVPGQDLLVLGRTVNVFLTVLLIVVGSAWSWKLWGWQGSILTSILLAFEPNVLSHGHLATTDIGYSLGLLASMFTFSLFLERPSRSRLLVSTVVFGLALLTRFNALILVFLLPLQFLLARGCSAGQPRVARRKIFGVVLLFSVVALFLVWLSYGFEVRPFDGPQDDAARQTILAPGRFLSFLTHTPIPAASYFSGFIKQYYHNLGGQWAYLFGRSADHGWWYYFPVAMLIKMTIASLLLGFVGLVAAARAWRKSRVPWTPTFVLLAFLVVTGSAMFSRLDLGVRYVLPSIALLTIASGGVSRMLPGRPRVRWVVISILLLFHVVSVVRFFPHFLPYANEAFGGPKELRRYLIDSNLDWGQDIPLVREYFLKNGMPEYTYRYFTTAPARPYGVVEKPIPTDAEVQAMPFEGMLAIGISELYYPLREYDWLKALTPTATLGYSTYVYDLRPR